MKAGICYAVNLSFIVNGYFVAWEKVNINWKSHLFLFSFWPNKNWHQMCKWWNYL